MRADMSKVIVERPRRCFRGRASLRSHRRQLNDPRSFDEAATHESSRRHYADRKSLNENLAPLQRFLRRHVGHAWNDVYAELRDGLRVDKATHLHILQHLHDFVCTTTWVNAHGALMGHGRWGGPAALVSGESWQRTLYVDPSGVLRLLRPARRPRGGHHAPRSRADVVVVGDEGALCRAGLWYALTLEPLPDGLPWGRRRVVVDPITRQPGVVFGPWDTVFDKSTSDVGPRDALAVYGRTDLYAAAVGLQLGKRALDRLGLRGLTQAPAKKSA